MTPFVREPAGALVTPEMVKPWLEGYSVECTFNAGVAELNGITYLLLRVAEKPPKAAPGFVNVPELRSRADGIWQVQVKTLSLSDGRYDFSDPRKIYDREAQTYVYLTSISHLRLARSTDGIHFTVDEQPFIQPDRELEGFGTEDSRITRIGDIFYINYTAVSRNGITTGLAETKDFVHVEKKGIIFVTENRDVTIFPEKISDKYLALTRPVPRQIGQAQIWMAASQDMYHWGEHQLLHLPRYDWNAARIGGGAPPIRTEKGWLVLYHGADRVSNRYSMGAALLDLRDPSKILAVSREPVLRAEASYEREGFYPNVCFSCGALLKGSAVWMYYGGADRVMALARAELGDILNAMESV